jgi:hypothetical protein
MAGPAVLGGLAHAHVLETTLVSPRLVAEISVDTAMTDGAWRHPVRLLRVRADVSPTDVPSYSMGSQPAQE